MEKLKVLICNNSINLFEQSLKRISEFYKNDSYNNIVIVPDKLSLLTEQSIFDALNIDAYFNIEVMGISKFANKIIEKNNLKTFQCSNLESKLLTLQAIQNVSEEFKCFSKKFTLGFVDEIYSKIEQIKSSNCEISCLIDENASQGTKLKFEDLRLIYKEYEKLRNGKLDSGCLLSLFNQICTESDFLKTCNVFFVGFDSLTKQGLELLKNVSKMANHTQVSVVAPNNQPNERIYDQSFLNSILEMAKSEKIECEFEWLNLPFKNNDKNLVLKNLFSRNQSLKQTDFYKVCRANSKTEEIELCAKQINYMLKTKNLKFNDFAICCNADYQKLLANTLQSLSIDTYCDATYALFDLEPIRFLFNYFCFITQKNDDFLFEILSNQFFNLEKQKSQQLLTALTKYGSLNNINNFYKTEDADVLNCVKNLISEKSENHSNCLELVKKIIKNQNLLENIEKISTIFEKNGDVLLNKIFLQIPSKLETAISLLESLIKENVSVEDFTSIFKKLLTEIEITSIPSTTNQVFIGDTKSFFNNKQFVFVLGLNEGELPIVLNDYGLISDKEINSKTIKAKLEPTTKIINKRNKFKLFEILLSAKESCYVYYHVFDKENKTAIKGDFVSELEHLFKIEEIPASKIKTILNEQNLNVAKICFNAPNAYHANLNLQENLPKKVQGIINSSLLKINKLYCKTKPNQTTNNFSKLFFKNGKASISIIEKYNKCPKSAFLGNALKLKPVKKNIVEANIIGTFLHEVGEEFVKKNMACLGKLSQKQIKFDVQNIIQNMQQNENYYSILLPENKFLFNLLKKESERFCCFINDEQNQSEFKPKYTEKYFGVGQGFKPITLEVDGINYYITGFVDRIDFFENNFRIIDYKTGKATNAKGMDYLFYGTKIQLFVYAKAIMQNTNKNMFGAFYLPIKSGFSKDGTTYQFSGFFQDDVGTFMASDKKVSPDNPKSELFNASLTKPDKNGEIRLKKKQNILTKQNMDACMEYAVQIVRQSIKDINSGFISCSPLKEKCTTCEFSKICKNAFNENIERKEIYEISKEKFMEINYGNKADRN